MSRLVFSALALAMVAAAPAAAIQVFSTGYDTPNGGGQASGGSYNYWDASYSGTGAKTTDGAALTGGSGDLTDGVVAGNYWYNTESGGGTGPYVGWYLPGLGAQANPTVTFYFSGNPKITSISAHIDNSYVGGVFSPGSVLVDGIGYGFTAPAIGTIGWLTINNLNLTGSSHSVQFYQANNAWVFVSEVTFGSDVPEPASWAMMIAGFGIVGTTMRRRRTAVA